MFPPQILTRVPPHVTPDVVEVCAGENVVVSLVVGEEGRALDARAARGPIDSRCKAAAEDAVRQWTFEPALDVSRMPVGARLTVSVEFEEAP